MFKKMNFTPVALEVLKFLARDPGGSFHSREVSTSAGVSSGAASLTLRRLHRARLIDLEKRGRMKFYRINLSNPVSRQFKVLFNLLALEDLAEGAKDSVDCLVLFGSCAEGTDMKDSDMDLFILAEDPSAVRNILRPFQRKLGRNLSPIMVDTEGLARIRKEDRSLHESISRGIVLWQRE